MAQPTYLELLTRQQAKEQYVRQDLRDGQVAGDVSDPAAETHAAVAAMVAAGGLSWEGSWNSIKQYQFKDVVEHQGSAWIAERSNAGKVPTLSSPDWDLFVSRGAPGPSGAGTSADWQNLYGRNNVPVAIGDTPALTTVIEGAIARATALTVINTIVLEVTSGGVLEGWYMLDTNNRVSREIKQTVAPGWYTITHSFVQRQVQQGDFYLDFYLQLTGGAATIAARQAETTVQSGAITGGASNQRPNFYLEDIIAPDFDINPGVTDQVTVTLISPIELSGSDTVTPTFDFATPVVDALKDGQFFFSVTLDVAGTVVTMSDGIPEYTYNILIDGGLEGTITTDASGSNTTDYASVFALSTGAHTVHINETGQEFTVEVA